MADTKLADLTALTTPSGDDILYIVDDPAGTPLDRKIALNNLFTRGTITASAPVLDASQTWNNGAVTFTGLKFNVVSDTSAAASLLMDLQVGGVSQFQITKAGRINGPSGANVNINGAVEIFTSQVRIASTLQFFTDTNLTRRGAANLRFGAADAAAPVAQTLSVQSVVAGTTNTAGANLTVTGSQGTGTGAGGSIIFQVAPAGSSGSAQNALATAWSISGAGHLLAGADNTYDIGASGANRPRNVYVAQLLFLGAGARIISGSSGSITLENNAGTGFDRLSFGGTTNLFPALKRSSTTLQARLADDSAFATIQGKLRADVNAVAETPTATHTITITDAAGTAYKVLCVAA